MLQVESVSVRYGGIQALSKVDLVILPEQVTTVIGSNGAGKSSLMKAITGLVRPSNGKVLFNGEDLVGLSPSEIVSRGIVLVPEGRELFPRMTVHENLLVGATLVRDRASRLELMERVLSLFPVLGKKFKANAATLSGGEQQMLAFGRALMAQPRILLLDEPSIGLAPMIEDQLMASVRAVAAELAISVLLVEQNAMLALENSDRAYVMELGRIVRDAPSKLLLDDPSIVAAYLGG